jgi:hypothetical protein
VLTGESTIYSSTSIQFTASNLLQPTVLRNSRFDEVNMELLTCMAALNPADSFVSFDAKKLHRLAEFYLNDFQALTC